MTNNERKGAIIVGNERVLMVQMAPFLNNLSDIALPIVQASKLEDRLRLLTRESINYSYWKNNGIEDAEQYSSQIRHSNPQDNLVSALVFCSYLGWDRAHVIDGSVDRENFFLHFVVDRNSFRSKHRPQDCVCMAGYVAGFTTFHLGKKAVVTEISCCKYGEESHCTFLLANEGRIQNHVDKLCKQLNMNPLKKSRIVLKWEEQTVQGKGSSFIAFTDENNSSSNNSNANSPKLNGGDRSLPISFSIERMKEDDEEVEGNRLFGTRMNEPLKGRLYFEKRNQDRFLFVRSNQVTKMVNFLRRLALWSQSQTQTIFHSVNLSLGIHMGSNDLKSLLLYGGMDERRRIEMLSYSMREMGWGLAKIHPTSVIFCSQELEHRKNSFLRIELRHGMEANSTTSSLQEGSKHYCCSMTKGYLLGWAEQALGMTMSVAEVGCVTRGDSFCTFLLSSPQLFQNHLEVYLNEYGIYDIPMGTSCLCHIQKSENKAE
eukprot:TRINITY_DN2808_c0_g1_i6.p1 TRINITY_DN2808_c0_g1~~TRINITY_DN2808_c0_g1_i6.p1  ORF type:complete len:487 (-),score=140.23 TRINITY_DN2808_c0_g1_i6:40-1500(-)